MDCEQIKVSIFDMFTIEFIPIGIMVYDKPLFNERAKLQNTWPLNYLHLIE